MAATVMTHISVLNHQLLGEIATTPMEFRPEKEGAVIDFELPSRKLSFRFEVKGHLLRLIVRDMRDERLGMSNIVLHDFREEEQPVMNLEVKQCAS